MRRPKAAIPILPPPDNQQSGRGRGRSTQQYQQNNQLGNMQQIEQEIKTNAVAGSDDKPVPGQFDCVQIEQSNTPKDQESQKIQASLDTVRTVNVDEVVVDKNTNIDTHIMLDASSVKKDNVDDSVSVKTLLETTSNEKDAVSYNPAILATTTTTETEHELSNIESAIAENTIVEKAAA